MSPGVPLPARNRRSASYHHVNGSPIAIQRMGEGSKSMGKITPQSRYSESATPSSATITLWSSTSDQPASRNPRNSVEESPATIAAASDSHCTCAQSQRTPSRNQPTSSVASTLTVASANFTSDRPARYVNMPTGEA